MIVCTLNYFIHTSARFLEGKALCYFLLCNNTGLVWRWNEAIMVGTHSPILYIRFTNTIVPFFYCVIFIHVFLTAMCSNYCMGFLLFST